MTELEEAVTREKTQETAPIEENVPEEEEAPVLAAEETEEAGLPEEITAEEIPPEEEALPEEETEAEDIVSSWRLTDELRQELEQVEEKAKTAEELEIKRAKKRASRHRYSYVGTFSAALSLIVMGAAMTLSLNSPSGILGAFKIAPVMLVFLGIEILAAVIINRSARLKFSVKSLAATVLLIGVSFAMSLISVTYSATGGERMFARERLHNMLAQKIHREIPSENIGSVDIELMLYGDGDKLYGSLSDLGDDDRVDIKFNFMKPQEGVYEFARDCRGIMDALEDMPYRFDNVGFYSDGKDKRFSLKLSWLYQSELGAAELVPLVGYYGDDLVSDIPDLEEE